MSSRSMDPEMNKPLHKFYSDAEEYWSKIPATIDGMLGGFGYISQVDIKGSKLFLQQILRCRNPPGRTHAVDCGAGIGRISKHLLLNIFQKVDLVEQNPKFLEKAKDYLGPTLLAKVDNFYQVGLQNFNPESNKYDIIWVQWVLGHLTDSDAILFFKTCKKALRPNGMIIVKENTTSSGTVEADEEDSSITRSLRVMKRIFIKSDLECYRQLKQTTFPKELYNVYMFALRPKVVTNTHTAPKSTPNSSTKETSEPEAHSSDDKNLHEILSNINVQTNEPQGKNEVDEETPEEEQATKST